MFGEPWGFQWPLFYSRVNLTRAILELGRSGLYSVLAHQIRDIGAARSQIKGGRGTRRTGEKRVVRRDGLVGFTTVSNRMNEVIIRPHIMKSLF